MRATVWKKSVIDPLGVTDITAYDGSDGGLIEIVQYGKRIVVTPAFARSLAGSIAAAASRIEASRKESA